MLLDKNSSFSKVFSPSHICSIFILETHPLKYLGQTNKLGFESLRSSIDALNSQRSIPSSLKVVQTDFCVSSIKTTKSVIEDF